MEKLYSILNNISSEIEDVFNEFKKHPIKTSVKVLVAVFILKIVYNFLKGR